MAGAGGAAAVGVNRRSLCLRKAASRGGFLLGILYLLLASRQTRLIDKALQSYLQSGVRPEARRISGTHSL